MNKTNCKSLFSFAIKIYQVKSTTENCFSWQVHDFGGKVDVYVAWKGGNDEQKGGNDEQKGGEVSVSGVIKLCEVSNISEKWRANIIPDKSEFHQAHF